jgi:hypothetical protein
MGRGQGLGHPRRHGHHSPGCDHDPALHWCRDVTLGEELSRARTGGGPRMMASLRNLVLSLLRLAGHTNIAKALRRNANHPKQAAEPVFTS